MSAPSKTAHARASHGALRFLRGCVRVAAALLVLALLVGTWREPHFWLTADQRGDRLMEQKEFRSAAEAYEDPWHVGTAQYRNGDFEAAAKTFARVPGATGAFDAGNALLMHGKYDAAVERYDRALGFRSGWREAQDNRALALARKKLLDDAGADRDQESADAYDPDEITTDPKGDDKKTPPQDMNAQEMSDTELRATWLRRVQTTPGQFLRAKFAYQAAHAGEPEAAGDDGGDDR